MKKIMILGLVAMFVLGLAAYVYATTSAKIGANGPHDIPAKVSGASGEPCAFCHTPHNATGKGSDATGVPLRNKTAANMAVFCMTCHDGAITVAGADVINQPSAGNLVGGNLSGTLYTLNASTMNIGDINHVANNYDASGSYNVKAGLRTANAAVGLLNGLTDKRRTMAEADITSMTCASCHDVHNNAAGTEPFLQGENTDSALCFACHDL